MAAMAIGSKMRAGLAAALAATSLGACVSDLGANTVDRSAVGIVSRVETGVLIGARPIKIEARQSGTGAVAGGTLGGILGSAAGGTSTDALIFGAVGANAGALAGAAAEEAATSNNGFAYTVQLDRNSEVITVTQGADVAIAVGTPVIVEYGDRARVLPLQGAVPLQGGVPQAS
ncbi:MAG: hypothetical protein ACFB2Z_13525 [Maricaulaceae bacterium]